MSAIDAALGRWRLAEDLLGELTARLDQNLNGDPGAEAIDSTFWPEIDAADEQVRRARTALVAEYESAGEINAARAVAKLVRGERWGDPCALSVDELHSVVVALASDPASPPESYR